MSHLVKSTLLAIVGAVILNVIVYFVGQAIGASYRLVGAPTPTATLPLVIVATLIGVIGATIAYAILRSDDGEPDLNFLYVAGAVLFLSLLGPFLMARGQANFILLGLMHVFAAMSAIFFLTGYKEDGV